VVEILIGRADVKINSKDGLGHTALLDAAENGHDAIVELLLRRPDVDVNNTVRGKECASNCG
jgi:ankyrin repeat protein